jgi:hypothetical protein
MPTIRINGFEVSFGRSISIQNGRVTVDGKDVTPEGKSIKVEIHGNVDSLDIDSCDKVQVSGDVGSHEVKAGDVTCRDVSGSVSTMAGDVNCNNVGGSVRTMSGDINRH